MKIAALIVCGLGALITLVNFYLSFISYPIHRLIAKDRSFKYSSPVPLVGSLLLWFGANLLRLAGSDGWPWPLVFSLLDTGGLHWFAAIMVWASVFRRNRK